MLKAPGPTDWSRVGSGILPEKIEMHEKRKTERLYYICYSWDMKLRGIIYQYKEPRFTPGSYERLQISLMV